MIHINTFKSRVSIIGNSFGIIVEGTGQDRGRVSDGLQQQPKHFRYLLFSFYFCSSMAIKIQIKIFKPIFLSSKPPLASLSKWQVQSFLSMINIFSTNKLKLPCESSNLSLPYSSKWVEKQTHKKIKKIEWVLLSWPPWGRLQKGTYVSKITEGQCKRDFSH